VRILVTGTRVEPLRSRLAELGHEVLVCPLVRIEPMGDGPVDVEPYDWVVLTSVTGAEQLRRRMRGRPRRVAAIGVATADAFGGADLVPAVSTQEGLLAELPRPAGRVLFAGAEDARQLLPDELGADVVTLYRTVELRPELPHADVAVLASASAARALGALGAPLPAVSIGPQTTRAAQAAGVRILAEARTHDVAGLVEACSSLS
jgi:uroporphyrinogen-III synthase